MYLYLLLCTLRQFLGKLWTENETDNRKSWARWVWQLILDTCYLIVTTSTQRWAFRNPSLFGNQRLKSDYRSTRSQILRHLISFLLYNVDEKLFFEMKQKWDLKMLLICILLMQWFLTWVTHYYCTVKKFTITFLKFKFQYEGLVPEWYYHFFWYCT